MKTMLKEIVILIAIIPIAYIFHHAMIFVPIINGYAAKYMCSSVFIAGHSEEIQRNEDLSSFPMRYTTTTVNYTDLSVSSSMFGFAQRKAIYRPGLGATLIGDLTEEDIRAQSFAIVYPPTVDQSNISWPMGNQLEDDITLSTINQEKLQNTINELFIEKDPHQLRRTRAVVILHDGKLIAERYAPGFSKDSKFLGWSMTKSIMGTLIGILAKQNKLNIDERAPVPEWDETEDPRRSITIRHLLQQTSGLDFNEDYYSKSDVTQMLFETSDMAAFAASHPLKDKPGSRCYYTSGNTNLLSRILRHTVGETEYHSFPYRNLFYKLGMYSMTMEVDASGTFVGSSYSWGTARDWARFGLLYLNKGMYNGERILSEDWIQQTVTLAGSNQYGQYGLHFWLNTGPKNDPSLRRFPSVPADMFYASGFNGQAVFIIPSRKLVVVRLGLTQTPGGEYGANEFLKNVIDSIE